MKSLGWYQERGLCHQEYAKIAFPTRRLVPWSGLLTPEVDIQGTHRAPDNRCKASNDFSSSSVGVTWSTISGTQWTSAGCPKKKKLGAPQNSWYHQRSVSTDCWEEGRSPSKPVDAHGNSDGREDAGMELTNWEVQSPQRVVHPLKIQKDANLPTCLKQAGPNIFFNSCVFLCHLYYQKHHSYSMFFLPG